MPREKDKQIRCPYCNRHLARSKGEYAQQKFCPSCGAQLPRPNAPGFNMMMKSAQHTTRACSLEIIAALVATSGALSAFIR